MTAMPWVAFNSWAKTDVFIAFENDGGRFHVGDEGNDTELEMHDMPILKHRGIINNNNNNNQDTVYSAVIMQSHCESSLEVHVMNTARRQVAAELWTKPTGLSHRPANIGTQ